MDEVTGGEITEARLTDERRRGRLFAIVAFATLMVGIGGFGTASSGDVEMFGATMEAKYACFIYFLAGALFAWSAREAKKRGTWS